MSERRFRKHLLDLVAIPSPSGREGPVADACERILAGCGFEVERDGADNVHARRGEPPFVLLNAHMDTVQDRDDLAKIKDGGLQRPRLDLRYGLDDKVGIAIILALADVTGLAFDVLLTTGEEVGGIGVREVDWDLHSDAMCCLTLDRGEHQEMVTHIFRSPLATPEWIDAIDRTFRSSGFEYRRVDGRACDAVTISKHLPTVNLSVGVYERHTKYEWVDVDHAMWTARAVGWLLTHDTQLRELHGGR